MNVNRPVVFNYGTEENTLEQQISSSNTETNNAKEEVKDEDNPKKSVSFSEETKPPRSKPTKATKQSAAKKRKPKPKQDTKSDPASDEKAAQLRKEIEERVRKEKEVYLKQEQLIDTPNATASFLKECGSYLQPSHYADVIVERSLAKLCGYPLCSKPPAQHTKQKYHINMTKKVVYDISELNSYCSEEHLIASQFFMAQLDDTPIYLRSLISLKPIVLYHENIEKAVKIEEKMQELVIVEKNIEKVEEIKKEIKKEPEIKKEQETIVKKEEKKEESNVQKNKVVEKPVANQIEGYTPSSTSITVPKVPKNVIPQLSNFGTCYMALDHWKTIDTMNYIDDKAPETLEAILDDEDMPPLEIDDKPSSLTDEIEMLVASRRAITSQMIATFLPEITSKLSLHLPSLEQELLKLIHTFSYEEPVDSHTPEQWRIFIFVFLELLSRRIALLAEKLGANEGATWKKALSHYKIREDEFKCFVDLFK